MRFKIHKTCCARGRHNMPPAPLTFGP